MEGNKLMSSKHFIGTGSNNVIQGLGVNFRYFYLVNDISTCSY